MALVWSIISTDRETTNNGIMMAHWSASDSEDVGDETYYGNSLVHAALYQIIQQGAL